MRFTFSILTLILALAAFGQGPKRVKPPRSGIHDLKVGANLLRSARTWLGSGEDAHEAQVMLGVNRANFVLDAGTAKNVRTGGYEYTSKGNYFRFGYSRNFVKRVESGNVLGLGLRYARASFDEEMVYSLDNGFGEQNINLSNSGVNARWIELVFDIRGKVTSQLYTGFSLRWKFSRKITGEGVLRTYDIPGFGTTARDNATSFDYYLMWRIPLKK